MPYTGIVLSILAAFSGAFLILLAHWGFSAGMFPQAVSKLAETYERRPVRATLVGIFTYGPLQFFGLNAGNMHNPAIKFVAIIAGFGSLLIALVGTAGLALKIGRNLSPNGDGWQQAMRGGVMLALVFITPLLGWFFALPVGLASGFGAFLLTRPWKAKVPPLPVAAPAPAPAALAAPMMEPAPATPEPVLS